jgi:subtilisin family serine protease
MLLSFVLSLVTITSAIVLPRSDGTITLPNTYIVKFKDGAPEAVREKHTAWIKSLREYSADGSLEHGLRHKFSLAFQGYSAVLDKVSLERVRRSPETGEITPVVGISAPSPAFLTEELDPQVKSDNERMLLATADNFTTNLAEIRTEQNKGWNAYRLTNRSYAPNGYQRAPWIHDGYLGQGVQVYVLDTGVNLAHPGFAGSKIVHGKNFVRGSNSTDIQGHGTMCAGLIAGTYAGLSPRATVTSIKVSNDKGVTFGDTTVAGIEHVVNSPGTVNNMKVISLSQTGFTGRQDVSIAVAAAVKRGVHVVVCAGNQDVDACNVQPSNAKGAIVVGSVNPYNMLPSLHTEIEGTNTGPCITIFAPGSRVPTLNTKNLNLASPYFGWGTSIATPQVSALIANRLSKVGPQTPEQIRRWLVSTATKDQIVGPLVRSPNLIAFSGVGEWEGTSGAGVFEPAIPAAPEALSTANVIKGKPKVDTV